MGIVNWLLAIVIPGENGFPLLFNDQFSIPNTQSVICTVVHHQNCQPPQKFAGNCLLRVENCPSINKVAELKKAAGRNEPAAFGFAEFLGLDSANPACAAR